VGGCNGGINQVRGCRLQNRLGGGGEGGKVPGGEKRQLENPPALRKGNIQRLGRHVSSGENGTRIPHNWAVNGGLPRESGL